MEAKLSTLARQIETLNKYPSEEIQNALNSNDSWELRRSLARLSISLETPGDIIDRIVYAVSSLM